jgi:hypothetical protein
MQVVYNGCRMKNVLFVNQSVDFEKYNINGRSFQVENLIDFNIFKISYLRLT